MGKSLSYMFGMCSDKTIFAYGYERKTQDLDQLGAGRRVYIDHDKKREERANMLRSLRSGNVVRVLYLRDLGGSPVADKLWQERVEAKGATLEVHRPVKPPGKMGRPRKFDPTPEQRVAIRAVWLDETRSLTDRCQGVADIFGSKVRRFTLYREFGKPGKPKGDD